MPPNLPKSIAPSLVFKPREKNQVIDSSGKINQNQQSSLENVTQGATPSRSSRRSSAVQQQAQIDSQNAEAQKQREREQQRVQQAQANQNLINFIRQGQSQPALPLPTSSRENITPPAQGPQRFSGTGLSPQQEESRQVLVESGLVKEESSATKLTVAPRSEVYESRQSSFREIVAPLFSADVLVALSGPALIGPRPGENSFYQRFTSGSERTVSLKEAYGNFENIDIAIGQRLNRIIKVQEVGIFSVAFNLGTQNPISQSFISRPLTNVALYYGGEFLFAGFDVALGGYIAKFDAVTSRGGVALRKTLTPSVKEISFIRISEEGIPTKVSSYRITTEILPPRMRAFARDVLGTIEILPSKKAFTSPAFGEVINNQPYIAKTIIPGSNIVKFENVGGSSRFLELPGDIASLSKNEKYLFDRLVESTRNLEVPIRLRSDVAFFKKDFSTFSSGDVLTYRLTELNVKTRTLNILPETGKRINRFLTISEIQPLLETETSQLFLTETFYKREINILPRASGNTARLTGELLVIKEPVYLRGFGSDIINLGKIGPTDFSPLSLKNLQKTLPGPSAKPSLPQQIDLKNFQDVLSSSPETSTIKLPTIPKVRLGEETKSQQDFFQINEQRIDILPRISQRVFDDVIQIPEIKQEPLIKERVSSKAFNIEKEIQKTIPLLKSTSKQESKSLNKQLQKQLNKNLTKGMKVPFPSVREPKPEEPFKEGKIKGFSIDMPKIPNIAVQVRRRGKFKTIGYGKTVEEAFNIGREVASATLGVTFRIKGAGKLPTPEGFKRAKKGSNTFVELPEFRLSRPTEIEEIQSFRRIKI